MNKYITTFGDSAISGFISLIPVFLYSFPSNFRSLETNNTLFMITWDPVNDPGPLSFTLD
jgi:hypothetical protein